MSCMEQSVSRVLEQVSQEKDMPSEYVHVAQRCTELDLPAPESESRRAFKRQKLSGTQESRAEECLDGTSEDTQSPSRTRPQCYYCGQSFARQYTLNRHHEQVHGVGSGWQLECRAAGCGRRFAMQDMLDRHQATVHIEGAAAGKRLCPGCGKYFRSDDIRRHMAARDGACSKLSRVPSNSLHAVTESASTFTPSPSEHVLQQSGEASLSRRADPGEGTPLSSKPSPVASSPCGELGPGSKYVDQSQVPEAATAPREDDVSDAEKISDPCASQEGLELSDPGVQMSHTPCQPVSCSAGDPSPLWFQDDDETAIIIEYLNAAHPKWHDLQRRVDDDAREDGPAAARSSVAVQARKFRRKGHLWQSATPSSGSLCYICSKPLGATAALIHSHALAHLRHPPKAEHRCNTCAIAFASKTDLAAHVTHWRVDAPYETECLLMGTNCEDDDWVGTALEYDFKTLMQARRTSYIRDLRIWEKAQLMDYVRKMFAVARTQSDEYELSICSMPIRMSIDSTTPSLESFLSDRVCQSDPAQSRIDLEQLQEEFAEIALASRKRTAGHKALPDPRAATKRVEEASETNCPPQVRLSLLGRLSLRRKLSNASGRRSHMISSPTLISSTYAHNLVVLPGNRAACLPHHGSTGESLRLQLISAFA